MTGHRVSYGQSGEDYLAYQFLYNRSPKTLLTCLILLCVLLTQVETSWPKYSSLSAPILMGSVYTEPTWSLCPEFSGESMPQSWVSVCTLLDFCICRGICLWNNAVDLCLHKNFQVPTNCILLDSCVCHDICLLNNAVDFSLHMNFQAPTNWRGQSAKYKLIYWGIMGRVVSAGVIRQCRDW